MAKSEEHRTNSEEQVNLREFKASPELSSLYTEDDRVRDHFSPTNQYHRPVKHEVDAQYPPSPIVAFPDTPVDTRWLGASQIKRPEYDALRQPQGVSSYDARKTQWISETPKESSSWSERYPPLSTGPNKINGEEIKHFKGYWKWVPQEELKSTNKNDEGHSVHSIPGYTEHHFSVPKTPFSKAPTSKDRPYNFESQEAPLTFYQNGEGLEGIKSDAIAWTTSEAPHLSTTELNSKEINILAERNKHLLDHKFK